MHSRSTLRALLSLVLLGFSAAMHAASEPPLPDGLYAEFVMPHGTVVAELFYQKAPLTVTHFVGLTEGSLAARDGHPFYTGLRWYRVVPNFVIQSGDPTYAPDKKDDDEAGRSLTFPDEFVPGLHHDRAGVLSMANAGPDTNSSEFFITLQETNRLNYLHSVFGRVIRGADLLPKITADEPITAIHIRRVGAAAKSFRADRAAFDALVAKTKKYSGPAEPGSAAYFDDPEHLLPVDPPRAKNFNYKLANFERATGLKIVARLMAKSPSPEDDAKPGVYMHALAERLGVAQRGILVAYFADEDDWRVWIGDELTSRFVGHPGTVQELTRSKAIHDTKEAFLKAAHDAGEADFAQQKASAPADRQPPPGQRIKLHTDAILDALILKFEPQ
jgi:cyclophilin family peptidyl-prolyl cis-trans isomerase